MTKIYTILFITTLSGLFQTYAFATDPVSLPVRSLDSISSRVFVYRIEAPLDFIGAHLHVKGRRFVTVANREFDVVNLPSGDLPVEVIQGGFSLEVCRAKLVIDPLKDNYLKIRNREGGFARSLLFGGIIGQAMDKADCNGVSEIVKVSEEIAFNEMKGLSFSPLKNPVDTEMTKEKICNFITKAKEAKCNVTPEMIAQYSPIRYTNAPGPNLNNSVSSPALSSANPTSGSGDVLVACKIGDNPPIQLNPSACLNVRGEILGAETLTCILGSNPPIKLSPDLCLKGGGRVIN